MNIIEQIFKEIRAHHCDICRDEGCEQDHYYCGYELDHGMELEECVGIVHQTIRRIINEYTENPDDEAYEISMRLLKELDKQ